MGQELTGKKGAPGGRRRPVRIAVFLDLDGVINRKAAEGRYVTAWEQMEFLPGVSGALRELKRGGFLIIITTNQSAISKKKLTKAALESIHAKMIQRLAEEGVTVDAVYYCPHDTTGKCRCRKPQPGMLLRAAEGHRIDLLSSWMVGDALSDVEMGRAME